MNVRLTRTIPPLEGLRYAWQLSPQRSEVFWDGLFLVLKLSPHMGTLTTLKKLAYSTLHIMVSCAKWQLYERRRRGLLRGSNRSSDVIGSHWATRRMLRASSTPSTTFLRYRYKWATLRLPYNHLQKLHNISSLDTVYAWFSLSERFVGGGIVTVPYQPTFPLTNWLTRYICNGRLVRVCS